MVAVDPLGLSLRYPTSLEPVIKMLREFPATRDALDALRANVDRNVEFVITNTSGVATDPRGLPIRVRGETTFAEDAGYGARLDTDEAKAYYAGCKGQRRTLFIRLQVSIGQKPATSLLSDNEWLSIRFAHELWHALNINTLDADEHFAYDQQDDYARAVNLRE